MYNFVLQVLVILGSIAELLIIGGFFALMIFLIKVVIRDELDHLWMGPKKKEHKHDIA